MRTTQSYRETKMRLLQKLTGIDFLKQAFDDQSEGRAWYNGAHRYSTLEEVVERFVHGKPISCFLGKEEGVFHVCIFNESWTSLKYVTLEAILSCLATRMCGVHFCAFQFWKNLSSNNVLVSTIDKTALDDIVESYALMLPFKKDDMSFESQFTLIYDDWDVLLCQDGHCKKGPPIPDEFVFDDEHLGYLNEHL